MTEIPRPADEPGPLCVDGHLVPRLYLLGAMKAATSSLALALIERGILSAGGDGQKERHWFDSDKHGLPSLHGSRARLAWAREGPACPSGYSVSADFTPANLALDEVPRLLREYYGAQRSSLRFAVLLREPLERLQSQFYHIAKKTAGRGVEQRHATFDAYVASALAVESGNATASFPKASSDLHKSLYYRNLQAYLEGPEAFAPGQFVVLPMRRFIQYPDEAVQAVARAVHWPAAHIAEAPHKNEGDFEKPPLAQDITPGTRYMVERLFASDRERLAQLLFEGHGRGMVLAGFAGRSQRDVEDWLTTWW